MDGYLSQPDQQMIAKAAAGDRASIDTLFSASADPTLDGERAEIQQARLLKYLQLVGPKEFMVNLRRQPPRVQWAVAHSVDEFVAKDDRYRDLHRELSAYPRPYNP